MRWLWLHCEPSHWTHLAPSRARVHGSAPPATTAATSGSTGHAVLRPKLWPLFPWRKSGTSYPGTRGCCVFMPAALPSLWGSPAHCLLREPLSRPVLPPGRRLPGPGAEGSQENSGGDPGEGQHRGECAGADGCCSCRPHVARGSAAPAEQKGANASALAAGLSVQSGERLPAPQTRVRGPRYAARPAPCRASSLPWRCSHRTPPVLGGRGHSPAPRPVTDDAHGGRATSEARCPARGSQPCWRGLAPRLTLRGPGAPGGVGLSAGRWGESR